MLNKLCAALTEDGLVRPGDHIVCAVSGGADSVALLFGLYLLKEKLGVTLSAAHFNHHLRGDESDGDEDFVRDFCAGYRIPLEVGGARVQPGPKGLEAAAREARYAFLRALPGKIATAHTADDNAETVLMHLLRGTGLKGLGGIRPVSGNVIRPMLAITRQEVEAFLAEYSLPHREDSSNAADAFLRNRIRHGVLPLLRQENPGAALAISAMARRVRQDEAFLQSLLEEDMPPVSRLRQLPPALQCRYAERFLKQNGIPEPEQAHITGVLALIASEKPSARMDFPGGAVIARDYDRLVRLYETAAPEAAEIPCSGERELPQWGIRIRCSPTPNGGVGVRTQGSLTVRGRREGDSLRLSGGTKSLKKRMIDRKISADRRGRIPVLADSGGVIWVEGFGFHLDRLSGPPTCYVVIEKIRPDTNVREE